MNNRRTRMKARKIIENVLREINELGIEHNIILSTAFFDRNNNVTDDSRLYCSGDDETVKVHAECLLDELKGNSISSHKRRFRLRKMKLIAKD